MSSLADFLLARIDEDEQAARLATGAGPDWRAESGTVSDPAAGRTIAEARAPELAACIARWDPARVLAECEAKRRIVEQWRTAERESEAYASPPLGPALGYRAVARFLALPYSDHPDHRDEWRP
jgi:hypothetical protein